MINEIKRIIVQFLSTSPSVLILVYILQHSDASHTVVRLLYDDCVKASCSRQAIHTAERDRIVRRVFTGHQLSDRPDA